jgi:hypothetical protein
MPDRTRAVEFTKRRPSAGSSNVAPPGDPFGHVPQPQYSLTRNAFGIFEDNRKGHGRAIGDWFRAGSDRLRPGADLNAAKVSASLKRGALELKTLRVIPWNKVRIESRPATVGRVA